jgi:hypothetical protein
MKTQVFTIVHGSNGPIWMLIGITVFFLALASLFAYIAYSSRNVRFEVSTDGLRIAGDMYGRTIPAGALDIARAQVLDLRHDRDHRPRWRTNGVGLPGYASGWFKLRNGEKSLVFLTDFSQAVYVPTTEGYSLLLSPEHPERFKDALIESVRSHAHG